MNIEVIEQNVFGDTFQYNVVVSDEESETEHRVTVSNDYWEELTEKRAEPAELVEESFRFLLELEQKESILPSFDLSDIQKHFPEYEETIRAHYAR